ncbi:MAG: DUF4112 domain-containing protein [Alphaproteobacteria bacterium]|nr:DUF4112 domain-containing protein [Alphaproteobacteria bacterium]
MPTRNFEQTARPAAQAGNDAVERSNGRRRQHLEAELASLEGIAEWLDSKFAIPGTGIRFGLDSIVGLIPGIGDTAALLPAGHIILTGRRLGASNLVTAQMIANVGIDWLVGLVPLLGDVLDVGFKANQRNVALLRDHFGVPPRPPRTIDHE